MLSTARVTSLGFSFQRVKSIPLRIKSLAWSGMLRSCCHRLWKVRMVEANIMPPPGILPLSSTMTFLPLSSRARTAATRPLPPPPITRISQLCSFMLSVSFPVFSL